MVSSCDECRHRLAYSFTVEIWASLVISSLALLPDQLTAYHFAAVLFAFLACWSFYSSQKTISSSSQLGTPVLTTVCGLLILALGPELVVIDEDVRWMNEDLWWTQQASSALLLVILVAVCLVAFGVSRINVLVPPLIMSIVSPKSRYPALVATAAMQGGPI